MRKNILITLLIATALTLLNVGFSGCYSFRDIAVDETIRTVNVHFIENRAPYINPQLSPTLSDRLRQKIVNQTRLTQVSGENAHYDIRGTITDYSVSTSGISNSDGRSQTSINRLTVTVQITRLNQLKPDEEPLEFSVSRSFDFGANQSLQQAEAQLLDEMVRNLTDEIFNRIFSNW